MSIVASNPELYKQIRDRVKISFFMDQGLDINGVVHVGTNDGYELQWYRQLGIEYFCGFEPLPLAVEAFQRNYPELKTGKEFFFPFALGNRNDRENLHQTTGDGQGSSFLEPTAAYKEKHPEYQYVDHIGVAVERFRDLIVHTHPLIPLDKFDCLVVDVQGRELDVLRGMEDYIKRFSYLNIELSEVPVYEESESAQEAVDFLEYHGFVQKSPIEEHNDVFFVRNDLI